MAKIAGFAQKIFGKNAINIGQVGSAAAGTKVLTSDAATIQALAAFENGISDVTISSKRIIPQEEFMALHYLHTLQNAYAQQEGIQEYNSGVTYFINSIVKKSGTYELYGSLVDDNVGNALTDGTKWSFLCDLSAISSLNLTENLLGAWASTTTATYTADKISLQNSSGFSITLSSYNKTLNTATSGAGGLDTGSLAISAWYYVWAIYNSSSSTENILFSASSTSPTLPSGYDYYCLIGCFRTDASSNIIGFIQKGNVWQYVVGSNLTALPSIISGSQGSISVPTWISASCSSVAPVSLIKEINLIVSMQATTGTDAIIVAPNSNYGNAASTTNPPPIAYDGSSLGAHGNWPIKMILESANIYYAADNANSAVFCFGFTLNLNV